jgi:hypothetical protein
MFRIALTKKFGYIRIFGFGLYYKNEKYMPLLFSEREGYTMHIISIGKWHVFRLN